MQKAIKQTIQLLLLIFIATTVRAQSRTEYCQVDAYWWHKETGMGSGYMIVDTFAVRVGADPLVKTLDYYDTGLKITIGIKFQYEKDRIRGTPTSIEQAIMVSKLKPQDIFEDENSSLTAGSYQKKWRGQSVIKKLNYDHRLYTFSLSCGGRIKLVKR
ncbi:MAG: hypothetical protein U0Z53_01480 [Blastocatellia bacterium]